MARREPTSVKDLLPRVLGRLAQTSGQARHLAAVWEEAAGPAIAQNARPFRLVGSELVLTVVSARWARELEGRQEELCRRLVDRLGGQVVTRLVFQLAEGAEATPR